MTLSNWRECAVRWGLRAGGRALDARTWRLWAVSCALRAVSWGLGAFIKPVQTGYVYHYAFFMIVSLMLVLGWVLIASDYSFLS